MQAKKIIYIKQQYNVKNRKLIKAILVIIGKTSHTRRINVVKIGILLSFSKKKTLVFESNC